jgi:hypothetical protein
MRYALAGLTLFAALGAGTGAQAHDRYYYVPKPPPVRYVVPAPRYYYPPPAYYYAPAPVYVYPGYRHHRPRHYAPQSSATFIFKF